MKLLVVEDNTVVLDAISQVFQSDDFQVTPVKSLPDAVAEVGTGRYDVVLLDTAIEGKKGLTLLDRVKAAEPSERSIFKRKKKDPAIVVIRHVGDVIPDDNPLLKGEVMFPFTAECLRTAVGQALPKEVTATYGLLGPDGEAPLQDLSRIGIATGKAYLFYQ